MTLGRRIYARLPLTLRHHLTGWALATGVGRGYLMLALRSLEAFGCDRYALADLVSDMRSLDDLYPAAIRQAKRWAASGREQLAAEHRASARATLRQATLFHAIAHRLAPQEERASSFALLRTAADEMRGLDPIATRRIEVAGCPAYFRSPADGARGCLVLVQGTNTSKDMFFDLEQMLLARGLAVLNLDQPGTGECLLLGRKVETLDELQAVASGIWQFIESQPELGIRRAGVFGFSLGGIVAPALCALDARFGACAMVATGLRLDAQTLDAEPPLLKARAMELAGVHTWEEAKAIAVRALDLTPLASAVRCPVRAFHGTRDDVLPLAGAKALFATVGSADKRLIALAGGDHTCSRALRSRVLPELFDWLADMLATDA